MPCVLWSVNNEITLKQRFKNKKQKKNLKIISSTLATARCSALIHCIAVKNGRIRLNSNQLYIKTNWDVRISEQHQQKCLLQSGKTWFSDRKTDVNRICKTTFCFHFCSYETWTKHNVLFQTNMTEVIKCSSRSIFLYYMCYIEWAKATRREKRVWHGRIDIDCQWLCISHPNTKMLIDRAHNL